ncbi:tRNA(fMet)-specific endonuclease VapC [Variibacter gotjawalensis]|uniref:Ribonuclease VapC n=1 Tax=Variibacter gotjawalensis TaxID=1333996 RepID=A0A0S3PSF1_9BRAD|nr:type II toxin-antitoxin system VapC family toxin [Variibacter gotjawalensis]NIK49076.1 tRNA(fMet)-specific endonuclease VapC [Variibacter gotjawalensis]RZS50932.1 tRNA(fMet)-specific endonuclease VapC [Variibacter gotjawalensis]BAT58766.1 tRNA(fMet)-specific endonuclease VapC [Variibacter gotjawalensis]
MIQHFLDTNAAITLMNYRPGRLFARVAAAPEKSVAVSALVVHELLYGAMRSAKIELNLKRIRLFLTDIPVFPFDAEDARVAGEVRAVLAARGTPIGPYDALIAAQAKVRNLTVITNNVREFSRVDGLRIEDWSAA